MEYYIRIATAKDQESILFLMKEHAQFEGHEIDFSMQHQQLNNIENLPVTLFVVEFNHKLYGYMSVIKQFSTWDMDWYLYLDCLYLTEDVRGKRIGLQLMAKLKCFAKKNSINTVQWQTPIDNLPAIKFYQKLNAVNKEKQRFFWSI